MRLVFRFLLIFLCISFDSSDYPHSFFVAASIRSMNSTPYRWSVLCGRQRASTSDRLTDKYRGPETFLERNRARRSRRRTLVR